MCVGEKVCVGDTVYVRVIVSVGEGPVVDEVVTVAVGCDPRYIAANPFNGECMLMLFVKLPAT